MMNTYRPEVVNQEIEYAEDHDEHYGAELGLEPDNNHDARDKAEHADRNSPDAPVSSENKSDEEEDEQDSPGKLEVHFAVLFVNLGQARGCEPFADPGVGENHKKAAHDRQIAEEEVQVEDEAVAEALKNNDGNQTRDGVFRILANDDIEGADNHGDYVDDQEGVGKTPWNYSMPTSENISSA